MGLRLIELYPEDLSALSKKFSCLQRKLGSKEKNAPSGVGENSGPKTIPAAFGNDFSPGSC
jgi:hypothetical protein